MGRLRVLSRRGDVAVIWETERAAVGDPEALAALREAERIFAEERECGSTAFRIVQGQLPQRLARFDPDANEIVIVPRISGGTAAGGPGGRGSARSVTNG